MGDSGKCGCCKGRIVVIGIAVAALAAAAVFCIRAARGRAAVAPSAGPAADAGAADVPVSVEERVQARIDERMADTNYVANLNLVAERFGDLSKLRGEAAKEFLDWQRGFLASNEEAGKVAIAVAEARERVAQLMQADGDQSGAIGAAQAEADALEARLKELCAADETGAKLLDKLEKIDEAIEGNRRIAADYIGARLRKQTEKEGAADMAAAKAAVQRKIDGGERGPATTNVTVRKAPAGTPPPRGKDWGADDTQVSAQRPKTGSDGQ